VLTSSALGFMRARSRAVTMPRVASTSRMWSETTSDSANSASFSGAASKPSARARSRDVSRAQTRTSMPKALPYPATTRPIRP
jgi:hypothetical protein